MWPVYIQLDEGSLIQHVNAGFLDIACVDNRLNDGHAGRFLIFSLCPLEELRPVAFFIYQDTTHNPALIKGCQPIPTAPVKDRQGFISYIYIYIYICLCVYGKSTQTIFWYYFRLDHC